MRNNPFAKDIQVNFHPKSFENGKAEYHHYHIAVYPSYEHHTVAFTVTVPFTVKRYEKDRKEVVKNISNTKSWNVTGVPTRMKSDQMIDF